MSNDHLQNSSGYFTSAEQPLDGLPDFVESFRRNPGAECGAIQLNARSRNFTVDLTWMEKQAPRCENPACHSSCSEPQVVRFERPHAEVLGKPEGLTKTVKGILYITQTNMESLALQGMVKN